MKATDIVAQAFATRPQQPPSIQSKPPKARVEQKETCTPAAQPVETASTSDPATKSSKPVHVRNWKKAVAQIGQSKNGRSADVFLKDQKAHGSGEPPCGQAPASPVVASTFKIHTDLDKSRGPAESTLRAVNEVANTRVQASSVSVKQLQMQNLAAESVQRSASDVSSQRQIGNGLHNHTPGLQNDQYASNEDVTSKKLLSISNSRKSADIGGQCQPTQEPEPDSAPFKEMERLPFFKRMVARFAAVEVGPSLCVFCREILHAHNVYHRCIDVPQA